MRHRCREFVGGDGLDVVDHESTARQGDGERFGDGVVGHIDVIPRLSVKVCPSIVRKSA
jgi:hypothetical protein